MIQVTGFTLVRWCTLTFMSKIYHGTQDVWHAGLWQHNGCVEFGKELCTLVSRDGGPPWLVAVQAVETISLIGLVISEITSLVLLCSRQKKIVKIFNLLLLIGSGVCNVIGLIIFEENHVEDFKAVFAIHDIVDIGSKSSLGISFYLCTIAAGLNLICVVNFVVDFRKNVPPDLRRPVQPEVSINAAVIQTEGSIPEGVHPQYNGPVAYGPQKTKPIQLDTKLEKYTEGIPASF